MGTFKLISRREIFFWWAGIIFQIRAPFLGSTILTIMGIITSVSANLPEILHVCMHNFMYVYIRTQYITLYECICIVSLNTYYEYVDDATIIILLCIFNLSCQINDCQ